ncbi:hypothetical protein BpHYR1_018047 [Brachionus plicatilis]|uniref:Uncharacterized protein n=1 Tax=Brachionus plicatilis TaxID=10195 RepID=A0A3M7RQH0_BRAPC|nr:hypothetical protein BpHYR1_018047 [Brachionus plicatilis]
MPDFFNIKNSARCGYVGFFVISFIFIVDFLLLMVIEFFNPKEKIDLAPDIKEHLFKYNKMIYKIKFK